jgi:hypothetical protein
MGFWDGADRISLGDFDGYLVGDFNPSEKY